ncbi:MAG: adenine-specific methyltransferase EcoRI family protein, partial [Bacteroidaceae bacterium]|nr:adenine-specific methyltransferase EcoRI family protein [Bacteroidaceae bacterium]
CNCDDPYESNFFKYFALRFNQLGLRKLIATCYDGSPVTGNELPLFTFDDEGGEKRVAYKVEITEVRDLNGDGAVDLSDVRILLQNDRNVLSLLTQHGDFRSPECVALLREADIVVTNPPFSLFREYIAQLVAFEKKFLIIGPLNALHYKEVFPLIKENRIWLGYNNGGKTYNKPDGTTQKMGNTGWYTNLDHKKRHEELDLVCRYIPEDYPHYENYDAIDVGKVGDIPYDWDGVMGVPDTILGQFNPDQFEIIGLGSGDLAKQAGVGKNYRGRTDLAITVGGKHKCPYSRILIRRKR